MQHHTLDRRTLMRAGAIFGGVTFSGLGIASPGISTEVGMEPMTGALIGWLVIQPDNSGRLNLIETHKQPGIVQRVAVEVIEPSASLEIAARRASAAVIKFVAGSWGVQQADCSCEWGRISHSQSGRSIPFKVWTDFA